MRYFKIFILSKKQLTEFSNGTFYFLEILKNLSSKKTLLSISKK